MCEPLGYWEYMDAISHDSGHYENNSNYDDILEEPEDDLYLGADPYAIVDD